MPHHLYQYLIITINYWIFTVTDGALRMLIVLYFHSLGYNALAIAMLFLFYELFGVITNLVGGWLAALIGLNRTMQIGTFLQVIALIMLTVDPNWLSTGYVMAAQALSGIAKDLNKMSAKSSIKLLTDKRGSNKLYQWVTVLTGSKNALKGIGFFVGSLLLAWFGFQQALLMLAASIFITFIATLILLKKNLGKPSIKPKFHHIFSKSKSINLLSAARLFLFGARDIWFVIALPVFMQASLHWSHTEVGSFMAFWIIGYGVVQSISPLITRNKHDNPPDRTTAVNWALLLTFIPLMIVWGMNLFPEAYIQIILLIGLLLFGVVFAINSAVHSFLILEFSKHDRVSLDVGFYYMANALGRLIGTVLSGVIFQYYGLLYCLIISSVFILTASIISMWLPPKKL